MRVHAAQARAHGANMVDRGSTAARHRIATNRQHVLKKMRRMPARGLKIRLAALTKIANLPTVGLHVTTVKYKEKKTGPRLNITTTSP